MNSGTFSGQWPSVATLTDGNFIICWQSFGDGSFYGIFGQIFDGNGAKIGSEFQANTYTNSFQERCSATGLSGGKFALAWSSSDPSRTGIYGRIFSDTPIPTTSSSSTSVSSSSGSITSGSTQTTGASTTNSPVDSSSSRLKSGLLWLWAAVGVTGKALGDRIIDRKVS